MELRVLRYFVTVARELSISSAADILHITQPTLSRQIMDLEDELGTQLIVRSSKKLSLTDAGIRLKKRAEDIISLTDKTKAEFIMGDSETAGDIYIGGGETDAMRLLARLATKLHTNNPDIHYHIFSGDSDDIAYKLDKGLLDFGVFVEPADKSKYEWLRLPTVDTWGLLIRTDNPLAKRDVIMPEDLWDIPLIVSRQTIKSREMQKWIGRDFEQLNVTATYNLLYNASLMVDEGYGCALCLDKIIRTNENKTLCFKPLSSDMKVHLDLVWKKYQIFSKAAELFLNECKSVFEEI